MSAQTPSTPSSSRLFPFDHELRADDQQDEDDLYVHDSEDASAAVNTSTGTTNGRAQDTSSSQTRFSQRGTFLNVNNGDDDADVYGATLVSQQGVVAETSAGNPKDDRLEDDEDATPPASPPNLNRNLWPSSRTNDLPIASSLRRRRSPSPNANNISYSIPRPYRRNYHGDNYGPDPWNARPDLTARSNLQSLISSIIISPAPASTRFAMLEDCKASVAPTEFETEAYVHPSQSLGIPFRELISAPMGELDVPPLLYELMQCQPRWDALDMEDHGMEVVEFLINNWHEDPTRRGRHGTLMGILREACWRRDEVGFVADDQDVARRLVLGVNTEGNRLFQLMKPLVESYHPVWKAKPVDYDISFAEFWGKEGPLNERGDEKGFKAMVLVKRFEELLKENIPGHGPGRGTSGSSSLLDNLRERYSQSSIRRASSSSSSGPAQRNPFAQRLNPYNVPKISSSTAKLPVVIEFVAAERVWALELRTDEAKLTLVDGAEVIVNVPIPAPPDNTDSPWTSDPFADPSSLECTLDTAIQVVTSLLVDARLRITRPDYSDPFEILFPRAPLRPSTHIGRSFITVKPFSAGFGLPSAWETEKGANWTPSGFDDPRLLHDGMLIMEVDVKLRVDGKSFEILDALRRHEGVCADTGVSQPRRASVLQTNISTGAPVAAARQETANTNVASSISPTTNPDPTPQPRHSPRAQVATPPIASTSNPLISTDDSGSESEWEVLTDAGSRTENGSETDGESSTLDGWVHARV